MSALAKEYGIPITGFEGSDLERCLAERGSFHSYEKEGWVLYLHCDDGTHMYKLKCNDYVNVHGILGKLTSQNIIIERIAHGTFDDLLAKVPDVYRKRLLSTFDTVQKFLKVKTDLIEHAYERVKDIPEQKDFAQAVMASVDKDIASYMFLKRRGQSYDLLEPKPNHFLKLGEIEEFLEHHKD